jgi:acid phosphatase family membrane protein YuiD
MALVTCHSPLVTALLNSSWESTVGLSSKENLIAAVNAFLTVGSSSLQKRELLATMRRFELGMHT